MTVDTGCTTHTLTRSGRISKKPDRLEPTEDVFEDDYSEGEYDTEYDNSDEDLCETETVTEDELSDSDEDEHGNLKGFVVDDDDDSDEEYEA